MDDLAFVVAVLLVAALPLAAVGLLRHSRAARVRLEARTVAELQTLARSQGLTGLSRLRKAELVERLLSSAVPG